MSTYHIHRSKHGHGHFNWQLDVSDDIALVYESFTLAVNAMNAHSIIGGASLEGLVGIVIKHAELTHPDGRVVATESMFLEHPPWQSRREEKNEARRAITDLRDGHE